MVRIKIDFFVWETISSFKAIQRYFKLIESQVAKVKDEEWEKLKTLPKPKDDEEYQTTYAPTVQAQNHEFENVLPKLFSYSCVMMLFSELEYRINEVCRELKKREKIPLKIYDFKGNLLERLSKFLIVANKLPLDENVMPELQNFLLIRNCIVHNNGFLMNFSESKKLRYLAKDKIHIEITGKGNDERIKISTNFLYSRIEFIITMFKKIFKNMNFGPEYPLIMKDSED